MTTALLRVVEVDFHYEKTVGNVRTVIDQPRIRVLATGVNDTGILGTLGNTPLTAPPGYTTVIRKVQNVSDDYA